MIIEDYKPKSKLLSDLIVSFYFTKSESNEYTEFTYYPHFCETINIFTNSSVKVTDDVFEVNFASGQNIITLSNAKSFFRKAIVKNKYDIIGIHFKPLALRSFFDLNAFESLGKAVFKLKDSDALESISELLNPKEKLKALEQFFADSYQPKELDDIALMVKCIHESNGNVTIKELAELSSLNRRTILRRFKKHLFCSFEEYKNIVRFRNAIVNFKEENKKSREYLTNDLYYDQSDFINHFKNLTGESPNKLISQMKSNPNSIDYFWKFHQS